MEYFSNGQKESYRRRLWNVVDEMLAEIPVKDRKVLYLDTSHACESLLLLRKGYRPENLYPCNSNPAHAAHITMKVRSEKGVHIKSHGGEVFARALYLARSGTKIDVYNFDLCTNVNFGVLSSFERLGRDCDLAGSVVAFTLLRGREKGSLRKTMNKMKGWLDRGSDEFRRAMILQSLNWNQQKEEMASRGCCLSPCQYHFEWIFQSTYKSTAGNQTMLFCASKLIAPSDCGSLAVVRWEEQYLAWDKLIRANLCHYHGQICASLRRGDAALAEKILSFSGDLYRYSDAVVSEYRKAIDG